MAESSKEAKLTLRLVVDEEKSKVVLAEACRDFVDVLFSLLTLPMGTIVRLLEDHRKERVTVGCFSNLYKSVVDMGTENFETEACKEILMNPRSVKEVQCKKLKLNINSSDDLKFFKCRNFTDCMLCSNFSTSRCRCDSLMSGEIEVPGVKAVGNRQNDDNGVFISGRSAFIITDDLQVAVRSTDLILKKLKSLGCGDVSKLGERLVDVGFQEVLTLLECLFSSNAPLTDTFLNKQAPQSVLQFYNWPSLRMRDEEDSEKTISFSAIVRKQDMKILYVECGEDFVDLLFTFLAIPLESVLEISGNSSNFGCIGNLFKSFKDLSATEISASKSVLPFYYKCQNQLLNIITDQPPSYYRYRTFGYPYIVDRLTTNPAQNSYEGVTLPVTLMDPKSHGRNQSTEGSRFAKKDTKFTVTDDLSVTPMNSSSTFCLLRRLQIQAEDLEVQEISITKTKATSLLGAALVTSSALNSALRNITLKNPKEET